MSRMMTVSRLITTLEGSDRNEHRHQFVRNWSLTGQFGDLDGYFALVTVLIVT